MTRPDIAAIQARADAATPAPWVQFADINTGDHEIRSGSRTDAPIAYMGAWGDQADSNNAAFICKARDDVPALLDYVAALEAKLSHRRDLTSKQICEVSKDNLVSLAHENDDVSFENVELQQRIAELEASLERAAKDAFAVELQRDDVLAQNHELRARVAELETTTARANRLEYTVVSAWLNGDITEGTAVTALNLPIVEARERLNILEGVHDDAAFAYSQNAGSGISSGKLGHEQWRESYIRRLEGLGVTDGLQDRNCDT